MSMDTGTVRFTNAELFRRMAARIDHNSDTTGISDQFGGAFVIVPPGGDPIMESLVLDPKQDVAHFFMLLQTKISQALEEIKQREARSHFGGR
jgi:hypothetical protein